MGMLLETWTVGLEGEAEGEWMYIPGGGVGGLVSGRGEPRVGNGQVLDQKRRESLIESEGSLTKDP